MVCDLRNNLFWMERRLEEINCRYASESVGFVSCRVHDKPELHEFYGYVTSNYSIRLQQSRK